MCNAFSIFFKCGHVEYAQGIPCGSPDCPAPFRQLLSHQICVSCTDYEYMGMRYANMNQTAVYEDLLFERNFDVEMIDPDIYSGISGVDERSISFEQPENLDPSRYQPIQNDLPAELGGGFQELQIEAPSHSTFIYPSPINPFSGWDHMRQAHEYPVYEDYAPSPDEEDVRGASHAPVMPSSSSYSSSGDSDAMPEYITPSPPFMPWPRQKGIFSSESSSYSPPLAVGRPNLRELSPTPGTRGHETFLDAASAILDLPLSWRQNGTLREFLAENEEEDSSGDEDEDGIDYTTPQYTKMRQPNFLRDDYDEFPPLNGLGATAPASSLMAVSTSDYTNLGTRPVDSEDDTASMPETVTRAYSTVKIGPYSLAPQEVMSSSN